MGADVVYVDVDDTLVRSASTKRIPIPASITKIRALRTAGATMYLWSAGGAEYAQTTAVELGIDLADRLTDALSLAKSRRKPLRDDYPQH